MKSTLISVAVSILLTACGGGSGQVPEPTPMIPIAKVFGWYESDNSVTVEHDEIIPWFPTHTVIDRDNNGKKEILIPPMGPLRSSIYSATDPSYIHFEIDNGKLSKLDTTNIFPKIPVGFINSMHVGKFSANSTGEDLVFLDLGREPYDLPYDLWPRGNVWGLFKNQSKNFNLTVMNESVGTKYWHSSFSPKDINGDGILDFVVGTMSNAYLYLSSSTGHNIIKTNFTAATSALIKLADGNYGAIALPYFYHVGTRYFTPNNITINKLNNQGTVVQQSVIDTMVCGKSSFDIMNGYAHIEVVDVNNDGLEDFIGITENSNHDYDKHSKFVSIFLQDKNGNFKCSNDDLNFKGWPYVLPGEVLLDTSPSYNNNLSRYITWGNYGDGIKGFMFVKKYVGNAKDLGKGYFYYGSDGKLHEDDLTSKMHLKNTDANEYTQVIPTKDLNGDRIVDFLLVKEFFSNDRKTASNPTGKYYKLTTLLSGIQ
jgi:hypothetical protein